VTEHLLVERGEVWLKHGAAAERVGSATVAAALHVSGGDAVLANPSLK